jgi:serine acetyltransferase
LTGEGREKRVTCTMARIRSCLGADIGMARHQREGQLLAHLFPSVFAVAMYRLAHALGRHRATLPARAVMIVAQMLTGAEIDWRARIGPGFFP